MTLIVSLALWTFIDTTLAENLQAQFGLSSEAVSLCYALQMAGFLLPSLLVNRTVNRLGAPLVITAGFLLQSFAVWLLGPSHILRSILPNTLPVILGGLLLCGLTGSFTSIAAYTEMNEPYLREHPGCNRDQLSDVLAGLYNAAFSLGTFIGPMAGSYVTIGLGSFRKCTDVFAIGALGYCMVLLVSVVATHHR